MTERITHTERLLSRDNLEAYVEGAEEIAMHIDDKVKRILDRGKRPTILIPSRGSVPLFLLARGTLAHELNPNIWVNSQAVRYYPQCIFTYLSDGAISQMLVVVRFKENTL